MSPAPGAAAAQTFEAFLKTGTYGAAGADAVGAGRSPKVIDGERERRHSSGGGGETSTTTTTSTTGRASPRSTAA